MEWAVFEQGARVLCSVPVTHSSCDPNSSSSPATALHFKQSCCRELDCVSSVFPPLFHGSLLCTGNEQERNTEEWLGLWPVWKYRFRLVVPQTEFPLAPLKQNQDLCWRLVFMFPYACLGCGKAGGPFISFTKQLQTVKRNSTWSSSYSFFWPLF